MPIKPICEIFPEKWESRAFRKFQVEEGEGMNTVQQIVAYLRYFNANLKKQYHRKGSGRKAISKRTGLPEYQIQIILTDFKDPDGRLPKVNSKYDI